MDRTKGRRTALAAISGLALTVGGAGLLTPAASSAPTPIRISITRLSETHRRITLTVTITPTAAMGRGRYGKPYVVLYRVEGRNSLYQLTYPTKGVVPAGGRITINGAYDEFGKLRRNRYAIAFNPAPGSGYTQVTKNFWMRLTR